MTPRAHRTRVPNNRTAAPYRSNTCRIGSHHECEHASPAVALVDIPVIFETCTCSCHHTTSPRGGKR